MISDECPPGHPADASPAHPPRPSAVRADAPRNAPAKVGELTYTRVHRASPELLFDCMTTPEHLAHFWGPNGTTTSVANFVVDLRPGGAFETTMVADADGSAYTMRAVYVEIRWPDLLVWTEPGSGMTTTITFTDLGDGTTEVVTHQTNVPEAYRSPEAQAGFATSLDRCDAYVASLVAASRERPDEGRTR